MKNHLIFVSSIIAIVYLTEINTAICQLSLFNTKGIVGNEVGISIIFKSDSLVQNISIIKGNIHLTNSTVFYPERISSKNTQLLNDLKRVDDSTYKFELQLKDKVEINDTLFTLYGEALAGNDSMCIVSFDSLIIDNKINVNGLSTKLITYSIGTPLFYVRHSTLEQNYPNPVNRGQTTTWHYRIDKTMRIHFHIYSLLGQELLSDDLGYLNLGIYKYQFKIDRQLPIGAYFIRLETENNDAYQVMHIIQ